MTTAALAAMEERLPWFSALGAEERSWITLVARSGIDGFVQWFAAEPGRRVVPAAMFDAAPRTLTRKISLRQTVDLVRTTVGVVEEQIQVAMPRTDRQVLSTAIIHYSREVAFAAAEVYARAAEQRGTWDARLEALVVDAVMRAETDETVVSRASTLGWQARTPVTVVVGTAPADATGAAEDVRRDAERLRVSALTAVQGERLVVILSTPELAAQTASEKAVGLATRLSSHFGKGPIVVGPVVDDLVDASMSARAAMSGHRAADAWPEGPRVIWASDLLPERALSGDGHARRTLSQDIYGPLEAAGGDLLTTCACFLDHGGSVEASARALYVHANTVRYRLKRIQDVTGYSPSDPRDAYVLRLAITLGRLASSR
ncbi:helix-turn-helix domain-containing protein [Aestuariimicrobium sp. p3-SID1156]|uniref:PucR family transcriptional regulator n=1 Tax=Aestuariimicrobium sp. p3-SID1156 TaxID=2916038 RepID=UPI00223AC52D|nr:helix-turn-helix domain-containing protein [Aestuariimicrobium sp. p3-SID1156]MCT1459935.1 helix-turn-helix domain-containing protein [Aestuariimicrobium sp. p3-SID1156]